MASFNDPPPERPKRLAIVDDHAIFRRGLGHLLGQQPDLLVVSQGSNGEDALRLVEEHSLDALVLDLAMPGTSGLEVLARLRDLAPRLGVLVLSGYAQERYGKLVIQQGARGYLSKDCDPQTMIDAVRCICSGHSYITAVVGAQLAAESIYRDGGVLGGLSRRECQVMLKLASGMSLKSTAAALRLSPKTVSLHRMRLLAKLHVSSNAELTYFTLKHDLLRFELQFR